MEGNSVMRPIDSLLIASRVTQSPADFEERSPWKSPPPLQIQILYSTPMLRTHRSPPGTMVQSRVSDMRVIQYWDKSHLVTKEITRVPSPELRACHGKGILWDSDSAVTDANAMGKFSGCLRGCSSWGLSTRSCREAAGPPARTGRD